VIRVADQRVLWDSPEAKYESPVAQFSSWSAGESDLLRTEIAKGSETLARQIGEAIFGAPTLTRIGGED
jgi:hypothetical protein